MRPLPHRTEMEQALLRSDSSYDGVLYTAVRTTGVFCRPSCPARKPRPENVEFFSTVADALFAGYRPCRRCDPLSAGGRPPAWVEGLLARIEGEPERRIRDADLREWGVEPARARRYFRRHFGMTFHAYGRSRRLAGALERLRLGEELDDVTFGTGFESASGFRGAFGRTFGTAPGRAAAAGCVRLSWIESPLGPLVAGETEEGLCLLEFTDRRMLETQLATVRHRLGRPLVPGVGPLGAPLRDQLAEYFAGRRRSFDLPLHAPGTPFERRVWEELLRIPCGETTSYQALARRLGRPGAARAVGSANGRNRIAILIPCHRVLSADGGPGGYGGGVWRKRALLHLERTGEPLAAEDARPRGQPTSRSPAPSASR